MMGHAFPKANSKASCMGVTSELAVNVVDVAEMDNDLPLV